MGTWVKTMPEDYWLQPSYCFDDVMLWQNDKVFVMDNHKSAAWCWLQQCKDDEQYNFIHIDRHYDMGDYYYDEDLIPVMENPHMVYKDLMNLKRSDGDYTLLRWDNYIRYVYELRPNWFLTNLFITQKNGAICDGWNRKKMVLTEKDELCLIAWLDQYLIESPENMYDMVEGSNELKWIVNLDLDFFFYHYGDDIQVQLFSDEYIRAVAKLLQKGMDRIQALTIAISPDCISGNGMKQKWNNGFRILKNMAEEIHFLREFPFPRDL